MKETGLMFKAPLVRSILDGTKTQTRRVAKLPHANPLGEWEALQLGGPDGGRTSAGKTMPAQMGIGHTRTGEILTSPQGGPGDRIYVRETWNWFDPQEIPADRVGPRAPFTGIAGGERPIEWVAAFAADGPLPYPGYDGRDHWRPSIHMPKWAARIWLDITGVRVERLQDISEADAKAEGVDAGKYHGLDRAYARAFSELWESTGGDWAANPWVWVIDFKKEKP